VAGAGFQADRWLKWRRILWKPRTIWTAKLNCLPNTPARSEPDTIELNLEIDGLEANCEVVWRAGKDVGVRFVGAPRKVAAKGVQVINPLVLP